ncbi:hypothetical protein TNCT_261511 [Trichonephila clavata]|uniref:Uncharacterized protein n=1 Tax=Trichonephila clavata TaxID=2740835 RepID=A0A8X6JF57_TRICU|nr:hypothetical protein TNCT_261511 [Trichonephila clavata]
MNAAERINDGGSTSAAGIPDQRWLLLITTINAQSLIAHSEDISTDSIINRPDYLAISDTWMEDAMPLNVLDFDLRSYGNTAKRRQIATTSSVYYHHQVAKPVESPYIATIASLIVLE